MFRPTLTRSTFLLVATSIGMGSIDAASARWRQLSVAAQATAQADQITAQLSEGVADLERGQVSEAKELFQRVLNRDPQNVAAHTYLGILAERENLLKEAEMHFAAAAIADPASPSARNNFGAILVKLGRKKQAATQFEISLRLNAKQPSALVNLAQIRFSEGTVEGLRASRELFERAAVAAPDAEISRALVVIALRLNDNEAAARYYRGYAEQVTSNGEGGTAILRAELGAALLEKGLSTEAVSELSASLASDASNAETILLLARAYLTQNQISSAGRLLEGAVARGAASPAIYAALSGLYEKSAHLENAIPAMRLAVADDPKNESYRFRYGMLLIDSKAPAAAVIRLEEALRDFPRSSRLWFALGVAHFAEHRTDEAMKAFAHAIELDPGFAPAVAYLGMAASEEGRYADAVGFYERSLAIDDKAAVAHYLLADTLLKQIPIESHRIESHLTRAVSLDASLASARLDLGKLYVQLARLPEAAEQFQRAVNLNPNIVEAHYQLGQIYRRLKRPDESQKELATFKRLSENQKEQTEADRRDIVRRLAKVRF